MLLGIEYYCENQTQNVNIFINLTMFIVFDIFKLHVSY